MSWHYYEAHVTIDPVQDYEPLRQAAQVDGFKLADLLLVKDGSKHETDMFLSARDESFTMITDRVTEFVRWLRFAGYVVRRYKIEYTIIDSRKGGDALGLLTT